MSEESDRFTKLRTGGGVFALAPRARIRVTGEDRVRYLNGQASNNLRRLQPGETLPALVMTAKGKLCASAVFWVDGEEIVVEADFSLGEDLLARLERYAIADDVAFSLEPASMPMWHVFGPAAEHVKGRRIARLGSLSGCDVDDLPQGLMEATDAESEALRILYGVPVWGRELDENTLPQEAGLERTAVDFSKGCYVGQEVVSRLKSVGRVNRRLCGFVGDFSPGAGVLFNEGDGEVGRITSATAVPGLAKTVALGYLSSREAGTHFSVKDESGACLGRVERCEFPLVVS